MLRPLRNWCQDHIDLVLLSSGVVVGVGFPTLLYQQMQQTGQREPWRVIILVAFVIVGISLTVVATGGWLGRFGAVEDRGGALIRTVLLLTLVVLVAFVVGVACEFLPRLDQRTAAAAGVEPEVAPATEIAYDPPEHIIEYVPEPEERKFLGQTVDAIRCASAFLGAMLGFYLATVRPPPDQAKMFWLSVFGAGVGWFLAYYVMGILVIGTVVFVIVSRVLPILPDLWARITDARRVRQGAPVSPVDTSAISDIRRQIEWTENSGAPEQFRNEEIGRLKQQIRDLGGVP